MAVAIGDLIRLCDGQWVAGFAKKIDVSSSLAAELWGLREGLALCVDVHAQAVEVELDAAAAISLISCNSRSNGDFSGLVDDCRDLLLQLPQAKVVHCYREANFCADALAKLGASSSDGGTSRGSRSCLSQKEAGSKNKCKCKNFSWMDRANLIKSVAICPP
ncbi:putative ribonuclease h protein [Quercus suber]|uniref:Ribonuclease h protein n=1 Tax=Quercus suber TaxID=58331 RepID=A0AAW0L9G9_QUESU